MLLERVDRKVSQTGGIFLIQVQLMHISHQGHTRAHTHVHTHLTTLTYGEL